MEYYWELRSKNAQNIKALMCPLYGKMRYVVLHLKKLFSLDAIYVPKSNQPLQMH